MTPLNALKTEEDSVDHIKNTLETVISGIIKQSGKILTSSESYIDRPLWERLLARTGASLYVKNQKEFEKDITDWENFKAEFKANNGFEFPHNFEEEEQILIFLIHSDFHKWNSTTLRKYFEESLLCKKHPWVIKSIELYFEKVSQKRFAKPEESSRFQF